MSAFFLAINRDQSAFQSEIAQGMMSAIDVFGKDHRKLKIKGHYALGYQSLWTTPEEINEEQPLVNTQSCIISLFHGRIDNRDYLINLLGLENNKISDADLMLRFYSRFSDVKLAQVIGPFAFVAFHYQSGRVFAARDGMGGRNLLYRVTEKHIFIATYEMAIVAHPSVDYKFNHARLGRVIARLVEDRLSSPISGITAIEPGTSISINIEDQQEVIPDTFYSLDGSRRTILDSDEAYAKRFRELLAQAVKRRTRAIGDIGSMLSGGFDSVPMSILLAQQLSQEQKQLTAFSWVFDRHQEVDERQYSSDVCHRFGINQVCINCDDVWPKFDDTTHVNPVMPFSIPYVELQQTAFLQASSRGVRTLLSGVHGDLLYGYTDSILWELLKQGRWRDFVTESKSRLRLSDNFSQWFKCYILRPLPFVAKRLEQKRLETPIENELLTDHVLSELKNTAPRLLGESLKSLRPIAYNLVMGGFAGEDIAYGRHIDAKHGIDRRYPFRDRELCEFMLSIPSDQLFYKGVTRPIVRRAFAKEFSQEMLDRKSKTSFYPAIKAGIENDSEHKKWYSKSIVGWQFYVKKCYFDPQSSKAPGLDVVRWQCAYYNYWMSICYDSTEFNLGLDDE